MSAPYFDFSKEKKHSDFSASASERWLSCPASVAFTKDIPKKDSSWAFEGTVAHELARCALETKVCPTKIRINKYTKDQDTIELVTDEMRKHTKGFVDYVHAVAKENNGKVIFETKVKLPWIHEGLGGTLDAGVIEEFGDIHVIDYKYGVGVGVEAEANSQMIIYGLGLAGAPATWDFNRMHTHVYQPRRDNISKHTLSKKELMVWVSKFSQGISNALDKDAKFNPSKDACRFCDGKPVCPALRKDIEKQAQLDFTDPSSLPVKSSSLTNEQLGSILKKAEMLVDWVNSLKAQAYHRIGVKGESVPGFKIVKARGRRVWNNQKRLEKVFSTNDEFWHPKEFKSVAQMENIKGKKWVESRCVYEPGKDKLVNEDDGREKLAGKVNQDFED